MKILALITARGGSKRLPGKNIKLLGGKPLIVWSIDVVKNNPNICEILISTDDSAIAEICIKAGAYVPWLRPSELASDTASSVDAVLHALDWYEASKGNVDGILLLQPTSPFRTQVTVNRGVELFRKNNHQTVVGVSETDAHPMWILKMEESYLVPFMQDHGFGKRSQDLPPLYAVNGSFYLISPAELRSTRSLVGMKTIPLLIKSQKEALDIDTEWDWFIAESSLNLN